MKKVFILIFIVVFAFFKFEPIKTNEKEVKKMEDLKGKSLKYAKEYALKNNLTLVVKEIFSEKENITEQSIPAGALIQNNYKVYITISSNRNFKKDNINELGKIPVMMYHNIYNMKNDETMYTKGNVDYHGYNRTTEAFKNDLKFYYESGYRAIRLSDYVDGKINVEYGKSPVVLTFDDGNINNARVTGLKENGDIIIDPNSALGIMEDFKSKHPDFNITATFFLNKELFKQSKYNAKIIDYLIKNGYDVANHTYDHEFLDKISKEEVTKQIGKMYETLKNYTNEFTNIVALPYGAPVSKNHVNFKTILKGTYGENNYSTKTTLRVGWESDYSPFSKNFDKTFIKRIRAYDNNGKDFDIEHNFKILKKVRFISDGNEEIITYPKENEIYIEKGLDLELNPY